MTRKPQKPPSHLTAETRRWYAQTASDYELEPHHLMLLQLAGECWDRAAECRKVVKKDGKTFRDRHGILRQHPLLKIEFDSRNQFMRSLRELGLDVDPPAENRPPIIPANSGLKARAQ